MKIIYIAILVFLLSCNIHHGFEERFIVIGKTKSIGIIGADYQLCLRDFSGQRAIALFVNRNVYSSANIGDTATMQDSMIIKIKNKVTNLKIQ